MICCWVLLLIESQGCFEVDSILCPPSLTKLFLIVFSDSQNESAQNRFASKFGKHVHFAHFKQSICQFEQLSNEHTSDLLYLFVLCSATSEKSEDKCVGQENLSCDVALLTGAWPHVFEPLTMHTSSNSLQPGRQRNAVSVDPPLASVSALTALSSLCMCVCVCALHSCFTLLFRCEAHPRSGKLARNVVDILLWSELDNGKSLQWTVKNVFHVWKIKMYREFGADSNTDSHCATTTKASRSHLYQSEWIVQKYMQVWRTWTKSYCTYKVWPTLSSLFNVGINPATDCNNLPKREIIGGALLNVDKSNHLRCKANSVTLFKKNSFIWFNIPFLWHDSRYANFRRSSSRFVHLFYKYLCSHIYIVLAGNICKYTWY